MQHAAREQRHVDVWRLGPVRAGDRPGFEREDAKSAVDVGGAAPESAKTRVGPGASGVIGVVETAVGVGLPGLHKGVADRFSGTVRDGAADPHGPGGAFGDRVGAVRPGQADVQVGPDRLGRGGVVAHSSPSRTSSSDSKGVCSRPRRTMSQR